MKGKRRKVFSKVIAVLMAVAFAFTLVPASPAKAAEGDSETTTSGIELSKTATLEDDGTYTINLEAYATGEVSTSSTVSPTDIVLVLDMSGSMLFSIDGKGYTKDQADKTYGAIEGYYYYGDPNDTQYTDGKYPARYYNNTWQYYKDSGWQKIGYNSSFSDNKLYVSRIGALKYAVNSFIDLTKEKNVAISDSNSQHRISIVTFASDGSTNQALTIVNESGATSLHSTVNGLSASGATNSAAGMTQAQAQLSNSGDREKVVVLFTDGVPTTQSSFSDSVACNAINTAYAMKQNNTKIFSINVLSDADPTYANVSGTSTTQKMNTYMNAVSSNYPNAKSGTNANSTSWRDLTLDTRDSKGDYYKKATSSSELESIFREISNSVGSTTVTLDENAVLKDIISTEFTLPDGFSASGNITVQTVNYQGNGVFNPTPETLNEAEVSVNGKEINVSGFSYKDNYVIDGSGDGKVQTSGKKLIVTISGVEATDSAATGSEVSTNASTSGIYENASAEEPTAVFERPMTIIGNKTYVLDYAKSTNLTDLGLSASHLDGDGLNKFDTSVSGVIEPYGKVSASNGTVNYTPTTTNWDGYDSFYTFGKNTSDANAWSKVSVLPANNVYYEDTFKTDKGAGTIGITYDDNWIVSTENGSGTNEEVANNSPYGWVEGLSDDTGDSDGTSHMTSTKTATATFKFTGTGVDVYSRTNMTSGKVYAKLSKLDSEGTIVSNKGLIVDTVSYSGEYYQIPTVSFNDLEYGTYQVTLKVQNDAVDGASYSYNIDGIRVYNPIQNQENDTTVQNAYGSANEQGAIFKEVRDILLDAKTTTSNTVDAEGVVFLDKLGDKVGATTSNIGEYTTYGPENEVYLAKDQAIAFKVSTAEDLSFYLGLKAPEGTAAAEVTNGSAKSELKDIKASDMYYKITPASDGTIVVKNTGNTLLSVTKLRTTSASGDAGDGGIVAASVPALLSYADEFDTLTVVAYSMEPEEDTDIDTPATGTDEEGQENEDINTGDVEIDNPGEGEQQPEEPQKPAFDIGKLIKKIFAGFSKLFRF